MQTPVASTESRGSMSTWLWGMPFFCCNGSSSSSIRVAIDSFHEFLDVSLKREPYLYVSLAAVFWVDIAASKYYYFKGSMNSIRHLPAWSWRQFCDGHVLACSDTAPMSSVIICRTTVATRNMLPRGSLFTLWAGTDWPVSSCLVFGGMESILL
jgi:hypothetical protein